MRFSFKEIIVSATLMATASSPAFAQVPTPAKTTTKTTAKRKPATSSLAEEIRQTVLASKGMVDAKRAADLPLESVEPSA